MAQSSIKHRDIFTGLLQATVIFIRAEQRELHLCTERNVSVLIREETEQCAESSELLNVGGPLFAWV